MQKELKRIIRDLESLIDKTNDIINAEPHGSLNHMTASRLNNWLNTSLCALKDYTLPGTKTEEDDYQEAGVFIDEYFPAEHRKEDVWYSPEELMRRAIEAYLNHNL